MANISQRVILRFKDKKFPARVRDLLISTGKIKIVGIGIFEVRRTKARKVRNISDGKPFTVSAFNRIVFHPTNELRVAIQTAL